MYLVTGGAGFIGSNVVAALATRGDAVVVNDSFGVGDKWKNIRHADVHEFVFPQDLAAWLARHIKQLQGVVHMGAISATTERDVDLIVRTNIQLSQLLWCWCAERRIPFIYASSAATYGDGAHGFEDDFTQDYLAKLKPLNAYGWSKLAFDRRVLRAVTTGENAPPKWAGLKFFNVYGPREDHKDDMRSVVRKNFETLLKGEPLRLFKSYRDDYPDGGQKRDFVHVDDCVAAILWMLDNPFPSSLYNIGAGAARTWVELGRAMFCAMNMPERIAFIEMPESLRDRYQYFTQSEMTKLRAAGFDRPSTPIEDGVTSYVAWLNADGAGG